MIALVVAAVLAAQPVVPVDLGEIAHAIDANRLEQARQMLAEAIRDGQSGPRIDRIAADLAFARHQWSEAEARYRGILRDDPRDVHSQERAGIAAIMLGGDDRARPLIKAATASGHATWRAWNALGAICDGEGDWDCADAAYATADELHPNAPEVLNNLGWSLLLRGAWADAVGVLENAAALDPKSRRTANNLDLARAAVAADLPERRRGESDESFAGRLNDAGLIAERRGDGQRATAAFTRALEVSGSWYARAANNLSRAQQP